MSRKKTDWSRRAFLRGAGVTMALPLLPSLLPRSAWAQDAEPPTRMLFWYVPCGIHMANWKPTATGTGYDLPTILQPLAPIQDKVSVLTGLSIMGGKDNRPGDHARGTGAFLTCRVPQYTDDASNDLGISVDQVAAQAVGDQTLFPSLQFGLEGGASSGTCDSGYPCAYQRNISWADKRTPLPKVHDPKSAFDRLFSGLDGLDAESAERRRALRLSVLDAVMEDANRLKGRMGATDKAKLDQYLTGVREVETRVESLHETVCEPPDSPERGLQTVEEAAAFSGIMAAAFQCDLTRIMTYMFANGGSGRNHTWLDGGDGNHHGLSHHQGDPAQHARLTVINRWEVEVFSRFLQRLDGITESDGSTVLDNSMIVFGSEISDGNRHNHDDMPMLLAGGGRGTFGQGQHAVYSDREPAANLYIRMLNGMGVPATSFGMDGTRSLSGLT